MPSPRGKNKGVFTIAVAVQTEKKSSQASLQPQVSQAAAKALPETVSGSPVLNLDSTQNPPHNLS